MKRFIIKVIVFFAIVGGIDVCVGFAGDYFQSHAKGGETRKINDLAMVDKPDILIMGSSRARHHYDAPFMSDSLGMNVYNAGVDGNGVVLAYGLLSLVLERYQPKLIVFDVEPSFDINKYDGDNGNKRYLTPIKPYYHHKGVEKVIKDISTEEWYKNHSGMIRFNTTIITKALDHFRGGAIVDNGYAPMNGVYEGEVPIRSGTSPGIDFLKTQYVEDFIQMARAKSVPIVFVASPKYGALSSEELQPAIDICDKYNVAFLDFYADSFFMQQKELFVEPMHLNSKGARIFTSMLLRSLNELSFININNYPNERD